MTYRYARFVVVVLFLCLTCGSFALSVDHTRIFRNSGTSQSQADKLLGLWRSQSEFGTFDLNFRSKSQLVFAGENFPYTLLPGIIRVQDGYETIDYGYQLQGNSLTLAFQEGYQLQFTRIGAPSGTAASYPAKQNKSRPAASQNREQAARSEANQASSTGSVKRASSSTVSSQEIGNKHWGFKGRPPQGWKFQQDQRGAVLGHDTIAGMILVVPHLAASQAEVEQNLRQGLIDEGIKMNLVGNLTAIGNGALAGDYSGVYQGQQAKARGIGTFSTYGGGAFIIALTTPAMYGADLTGAAETFARNLQYIQVDVSELAAFFVGMWAHVTANTLTNFELYENGTFSSTYEAGYSGSFQNDLGHQTGNWGVANNEGSQGRWTIRGTREAGALILNWPNGEQELVEFTVHRKGGQTYWSEYFFDGVLYSKRR